MKEKAGSVQRVSSFDLAPGRMIARKYRVLSQLGAGWEGEVYKILEVNTKIERAAKIFFPQRNVRNKISKRNAQKLHKLRHCSILIQYHTEEVLIYKKMPVTVLISEYVEGQLLSKFVNSLPGKRMDPYQALHLLHSLVKGVEEIHLLNEYHGDLHTDNIIVNKFGLGFELKLVDLFHHVAPKNTTRQIDLVALIQIFHECMGGQKWYAKMPPPVKNICCGLKKSLILKKFRSASQLREYLEQMEWMPIRDLNPLSRS